MAKTGRNKKCTFDADSQEGVLRAGHFETALRLAGAW
jgi:hypothetical protein